MKLRQHTNDWCHICGKREKLLCDVWYPQNAEHDKKDTKYIRICSVCSLTIYNKAEKG